MQSVAKSFWVADVNVRGELELKAEYQYDALHQISGAAELIGDFSGALWRTPRDSSSGSRWKGPEMALHWQSTSHTTGIATLWQSKDLVSLSLLASGVDEEADRITLEAFQHHLLTELHDTGIEPACALLNLTERPLVATVNFSRPKARSRRSPRHWPTAASPRLTSGTSGSCDGGSRCQLRHVAFVRSAGFSPYLHPAKEIRAEARTTNEERDCTPTTMASREPPAVNTTRTVKKQDGTGEPELIRAAVLLVDEC